MSNYLWCSACEHVFERTDWTRNGMFKHGICPNSRCVSRAYSYAREWAEIAIANGYPKEPVNGKHYPMYTLFDESSFH